MGTGVELNMAPIYGLLSILPVSLIICGLMLWWVMKR